jgi:hypothetical protein
MSVREERGRATETRLPPARRTALALAALFLVDLGFMGQGIFSFLVAVAGLIVLTLAATWSLLRGQRPLAANRAGRAVLYVLLGVATMGALRFHASTARTNAALVIEACRSYQAKRGAYPDRLEALVPDFLPAVPRAKYTFMFGDFTYWSTPPSSHTLMYVALPPFGRRIYHFEADRWGQLD